MSSLFQVWHLFLSFSWPTWPLLSYCFNNSKSFQKGFIFVIYLSASVLSWNLIRASFGLGQYLHKQLNGTEVQLNTIFSTGMFYLLSNPLFISTEHVSLTICHAAETLEGKWNYCWYILELCDHSLYLPTGTVIQLNFLPEWFCLRLSPMWWVRWVP